MADEETRRRLDNLERKVDNGHFVRVDRYEADIRAQEKVDIAQQAQYAALDERVDEVREAGTWLQRQIFIIMAGILATFVGSIILWLVTQ